MPFVRKISGNTNADKVFDDVYNILNKLDNSVVSIGAGTDTFLKLDQTQPQTITDDVPIFNALTESSIVETDADKQFVSVTKNSGYNLALGTTEGTVSQGNHTHSGVYIKIDQTTPDTVINGAPYFSGGIKSPKVYPNADSTTAFQICKANGSTSVLTVDTTNSRLGINCTPSQTLEVNGTSKFAGITQHGTNYINNTGAASKGLYFDGSNIPSIVNTSAVFGDSRVNLLIDDDAAMAAGVGGGIVFRGKYTAAGVYAYLGAIKGVKANATEANYEGQLHLQTRPSGSTLTTRMIIDENGKVIIDDLTASYIVHTGSSKELVSVAINTGYNLALVSNAYVPVSNGSAYINSYISQTTNVINIATDTGYGIRIMRDDEDIYDEIHAHSTGLLLKTDYDANTSSPCWLRMQSEDTSPDYANGELRIDDCYLTIVSNKNTNVYSFDFTMHSLPGLKITSDDDGLVSVAIGNITGTEHLDVEGKARIRDIEESVWESLPLYFDENGVLCSDSSDICFKKDITTIENALDKVIKLRGVNYRQKQSNRNSLLTGFIAQEVKEICPELTFMNKETMGVRYDRVVSLLVEAIKEQQIQIDKLTNKGSDNVNRSNPNV